MQRAAGDGKLAERAPNTANAHAKVLGELPKVIQSGKEIVVHHANSSAAEFASIAVFRDTQQEVAVPCQISYQQSRRHILRGGLGRRGEDGVWQRADQGQAHP